MVFQIPLVGEISGSLQKITKVGGLTFTWVVYRIFSRLPFSMGGWFMATASMTTWFSTLVATRMELASAASRIISGSRLIRCWVRADTYTTLA